MGYQQKKYKKFVATAATATLVASAIVPVASAKSFSDVAENNEFQPFINALSDSKIINGYADGTFKPGAKLTRGQVVKMLGRWVESNGTAVPTDWNSKQRFNDVPVNGADQELVKYAALVKDSGVFNGSNGNLMAGNNITRQQMAKVLNGAYEAVKGVSLVELAKGVDDVLIQDLGKSYQEFEGHIQALVDLKISTVSVFRPTENVTRAQFAKFLYNTINLNAETVGEVTYKVAAVNATTVEVTFPSDIKNIKDLDFKIEGLEVKNAVVKQTAANVAVLTTSAQQADKEYAVTVDGEKVGSFKGIGAVIPTEIKVETASEQAKVGQQVTLKAKTTPGAAVTFNVQATGNTLNENKKHEVIAGTDGIATYTYTQYGVAGVDNVTVYPTGAPNLLDYAKVYWGKDTILAVDAEEKTVDNGANRTYTVTYKDATTGQPVSGKKINVTFKENLNDVAGSVKTDDTDASIRKDNGSYVTPYQDTVANAGTNREEAFQVTTNSEGKATFVVTGKNTTATPIVFEDADKNNRFGATELQATAGAIKFQGVQTPYQISFTQPTADRVAAISYDAVTGKSQNNPVEYKLKVVTDKKDKDGKPLPYVGAKIKVAIQQNIDDTLTNNTPAQIATSENGSYTTSGSVEVRTDANGEAKVYLRSTVDNSKATPVAWIDLNTAGAVDTVGNSKLESGEPFGVAPTVTFLKSVVVEPNYVLNAPTVGAFVNGDTMKWTTTLRNQSANTSETSGVKNVTYTITNTSNVAQKINPYVVTTTGTAYNSMTITYNNSTLTQSFKNGDTVNLEPGTTVTIHGIAPQYTPKNTSVTPERGEFSTTSDAELRIVAPTLNSSSEAKLSVSGAVTTVKRTYNGDTRNDNNTYNYNAKEATYVDSELVSNFDSSEKLEKLQIITGEVIGYELTDKTNSFNQFDNKKEFGSAKDKEPATYYGRLVIKERATGKIKHYYYDDASKFTSALAYAFTSTDNPIDNATAFEKLLTVGDEVQLNANASGGKANKSIRLFNEDKSTSTKPEGNGANEGTFDIKNAVTVSSKGDGTVDKVQVTFNKEVITTELNNLLRIVDNNKQYLEGIRLNNAYTLSNPEVTTEYTNGQTVVTFDIVDVEKFNTAKHAGATLTVTASEAAKLDTAMALSEVVKDGVAPIVVSKSSYDGDKNGSVDTVEFTFSEAVTNVKAEDFRFSYSNAPAGEFVSGKSATIDGNKVIVKFDNPNAALYNATSLTYNYAENNYASAGAVQDATGNKLVSDTVYVKVGSLTKEEAIQSANNAANAIKVEAGKLAEAKAAVAKAKEAIAAAKVAGATDADLQDVQAKVKAAEEAIAKLEAGNNPGTGGNTLTEAELLVAGKNIEVVKVMDGLYTIMFNPADLKQEYANKTIKVVVAGKEVVAASSNGKLAAAVTTGLTQDQIKEQVKFIVE